MQTQHPDRRTMTRRNAAFNALVLLFSCSALPSPVSAHTFGQSYVLPIPLEIYGWTAGAVLAISFIAAAWFLRERRLATPPVRDWPADGLLSRSLLNGFRLLAVLLLAVTISAGLFGHPNRSSNLSMPLFWMIFVIGFAYLSAFFGGLYEAANPWRSVSLVLGQLLRPFRDGLLRYPADRLAYWPALFFYLLFIWVELFGHTKPVTLAHWLLGYSVVTLSGSFLFGAAAWFRYAEFFAVFLRIVSRMAPFAIEQDRQGQYRWKLRWQFSGLLGQRPEHNSLTFFIVCMLATTAYDGFHETVPWLRFFWSTLIPWWDPDIGLRALWVYRHWLDYYLWLGLPLACGFYFLLYVLAVWLGRTLARSRKPLGELLRRFAFTLVPIALVYHASHYYTFIQTDAIRVIPLLSDPFNQGWDLFGTRDMFKYTIIPSMDVTWHTQVALIIVGHLVSVILAHREALQIFGNARQATLSQLPMLILMVTYTVAGLWILALPIQTPRFL